MKRHPATCILLAGIIALVIASCQQAVTEGSETPKIVEPQTGLMKEMGVMFTGEEDHTITPDAAIQMITAFQKDNPYKTYAWYFSKKAVGQLLAQEECVGIRIYGGLHEDSLFSPVVFGVNASGRDLIGGGLSKTLSDSLCCQPLEDAFPCPPYCDWD